MPESTVSVGSSGVLDFNTQFKLQGSGSEQLIAQGTLRVESSLDGWLLLRAEGWLAVTIDGKVQSRRAAPVSHARGWDAVPLRLTSGNHAVRLDCLRANDHWSLMARIIDQTGHAPSGATWSLPSRLGSRSSKIEPFEVTLDLSADAPTGLRLKIDAPLGTELPAGERVRISLSSTDGAEPKSFLVGTWPRDSTPVAPLVVQVGTLAELVREYSHDDSSLNIEIEVGTHHVRRKLHLTQQVLNAWQRVAEQLQALDARQASELDIDRASLQIAQFDLSAAVTKDAAIAEINRAAQRAQSLAKVVSASRPPWAEPGIHELAWRSSADQSLQRFALQVPSQSEGAGPLPLVLVLHGYNGTPLRILEAFLDTAPGASAVKVNGYILAPAAHGNAFYRGPGERDILEILDWALRVLPIDKNRVSITGASMGGTGTAEIALHYPDRFAALAPLCGYHSYYVRRDTSLQPLRSWERRLMHRFSPASSADSGRYLPLYLAHGLKDRPLENSRILTTRYKKLGYRLIEDWPDLGHAVWKKTWAHAGLFPWLSTQARVCDPSRITIAATALRHAQSYWLNVLELDSNAELPRIDVEVVAANEIHVTTSGVTAFAFAATTHIDRNQPLLLDIDGIKLKAAPASNLHFFRQGSSWTQGDVSQGSPHKALDVEGPWLDLWSEPLAFVYGTGNPSTTGVNFNVAQALASPQGGTDTNYLVISDRDYALSRHEGIVPVFVGNAADNSVLSKWANRLPLSVDAQSITVGGHRFTGDKLGAVYVYPNPDDSRHIIGVITAPTAGGLWQALALPMLVPDFMVYDYRVAPAGGEPILGRHGRVLAAGFFNSDWSLPKKLSDPLDEAP
jgi:predicted esterase